MNIFITGGTSGLGLSLANFYHSKGHSVGICSVETNEVARKVISNQIEYYQANVLDIENLKYAIESFSKKNKGLDLIIANAGISLEKSKIPDFEAGKKVIEIKNKNILYTNLNHQKIF